ncbi:MAG: GNAT family N-acetyltransferase [Dehalococcoidia bacterium]|nr:GNAT family N-acetyltransferase [Dehalococcoidia bacterium]
MKALMLQYHFDSTRDSRSNSPSIQKELYYLIRISQVWYPEILHWYFQKFVPGLNHDSRHILTFIVDNKVAGIALLKNEAAEKKICTFRVKDQYRNNGIGKTLFRRCLEILETDKPMITVPSERLSYFSNLFKHYDFKLEQVVQDYYRSNSSEYVFNGSLTPPSLSIPTHQPFLRKRGGKAPS